MASLPALQVQTQTRARRRTGNTSIKTQRKAFREYSYLIAIDYRVQTMSDHDDRPPFE